ncbi:MAG: radical SAM protein [Candidatus Acididesulfobacter diazotrophicus]|jgi:putative pyruvate formate lyase activating enzyme|uniref:Radical SAM protein n=1 Tax=Candidatus Acididesulfobacter diazotrophicus TaxID=2597226 RepID=A0A519BQK9_9DELT|nr:MAG: radical SAM protein [Candidatus Acididesulfobacter diazotrophicus]
MTGEDFLYRIKYLYKITESCSLCPRCCNAKRFKAEEGLCGAKDKLRIASFNIHKGEEPCISGRNGSGTIFFSGCSLKCKFCQNYPISRFYNGKNYNVSELSDIMIKLQKRGAHNINLVTSTHFMPFIVEALYIAKDKGLKIPVIYNSSGYETEELIEILDGIIDIYLPDIKYSDNKIALKYSGADNYVEVNRKALKKIYKQSGELQTDFSGIAIKGMLVRHLVLPEDLSGYKESFKFIAEELSKNIPVSLMSQYFPAYKAFNDNAVNRKITAEEYIKAVDCLSNAGLAGYYQTDLINDLTI